MGLSMEVKSTKFVLRFTVRATDVLGTLARVMLRQSTVTRNFLESFPLANIPGLSYNLIGH